MNDLALSSDGSTELDPLVQWENSVQPPNMIDPIAIVINEQTPLQWMHDFDRVGCDGYLYEIRLPKESDALVTMDEHMGPLQYPLWITGGNNVHVRGLEFRTEVQPGCGIGEAHQIRDRRLNIHPRLVGGKVMRLEQRGTTFLEGIDIDLQGQEADCFVSRNERRMTPQEVKAERNVHIVNSRCTGIEGLDSSPIGDGIHGDFFQNQGLDNLGSLILENVTYRTSSNGVTLHSWTGSRNRARLFHMKNVDYGWDLRYSHDSRYEISGLAFSGNADTVLFENVWLNHGRSPAYNYGFIGRSRFGAYQLGNYITKMEGLNSGPAPLGEFATTERTGLGYLSPFDQDATNVQ